MKKSVVAGIAGSVRIAPLNMADLRAQERHGKREDRTSQMRRISDKPPLTTTGLNLRDLYHAHIEGCFLPRSSTKVLHAIVQFPKELDGVPDDHALLEHAIKFAAGIWGEEAVFATRLDLDEKSSRVVDLFMAPKYLKVTKADPEGKMAIAMTRHGKELAKKYNRVSGKTETKYNPVSGEIEEGKKFAATWDVGRAIQDEFHRYLRDEMGLVGVARGAPKAQYGPDWKSSEELRARQLDELEDQLTKREAELAVKEAKVRIDEEKALDLITDKIPRWRKEAEAEARKQGYDDGKASARAEAEEERKAVAAEKRAAEEERRRAEEKRIEQEKLLSAANGERMRLAAERAKVEQERREAAEQKLAVQKRRKSIEVGLEALLDGDLVYYGIADGKRYMQLRHDMAPEDKNRLKDAIQPSMHWLTNLAEKFSVIVAAKLKVREDDLQRREKANRTERDRLQALKKKLDKRWNDLNFVMDQTKESLKIFKSAFAPLAEWKEKFEAATGLKKQAMSFHRKAKLVENAMADSSVADAMAADAEFDNLEAAYKAFKDKSAGWDR